MSRQAKICPGLGFIRVLLCVLIAAAAVRLELNAADTRAGNTAAAPGRDADARPRMSVLATCLSRSRIPPDQRLDRLVTPFAIAENPAKYEGYQQDTDGTDGNEYMHPWGAGIRPRTNGEPPFDSATKPLAGSIAATNGIPPGATWVFLDAWYVVGPFRNPDRSEIDRKFGPELTGGGTGQVTVADLRIPEACDTTGGTTSVWRLVRSPDSVRIQPTAPSDWAVWYAYAEVYSDRDREAWCIFGSDDWGKAWVNGKLEYLSGRTPHPWVPDRDFRKTQMRKGYNPVFFKLENAWGRTGFSMCIFVGDPD